MLSRYFFVVLLLAGSMAQARAGSDGYLMCYVEMHDAENLEKNRDYFAALVEFKVVYAYHQAIHEVDPHWGADMIKKQLKDWQDHINNLHPLATNQIKGNYPSGPSDPALDQLIRDAQGEQKSNKWAAINLYEKYLTILELMHEADPQWQTALVGQKIKETQSQIDQLTKFLANQNWGGEGFDSRPVL